MCRIRLRPEWWSNHDLWRTAWLGQNSLVIGKNLKKMFLSKCIPTIETIAWSMLYQSFHKQFWTELFRPNCCHFPLDFQSPTVYLGYFFFNTYVQTTDNLSILLKIGSGSSCRVATETNTKRNKMGNIWKCRQHFSDINSCNTNFTKILCFQGGPSGHHSHPLPSPFLIIAWNGCIINFGKNISSNWGKNEDQSLKFSPRFMLLWSL